MLQIEHQWKFYYRNQLQILVMLILNGHYTKVCNWLDFKSWVIKLIKLIIEGPNWMLSNNCRIIFIL